MLTQEKILQHLPHAGGTLRIAFSGGLDSTVLCHALRGVSHVAALHVNHHMQADADAWQAHCQAHCDAWGMPLDVLHVYPQDRAAGPEAAARSARYAALATRIKANDALVTAHHADDQAETFLLQALRGAGVRGLASMPQRAAFAQGQIARPLLGFTRKELLAYAEQHGLHWIEDPSNADPALGRGYLRAQLSPLFALRWPGYQLPLSRAAQWCAQASALNDDLAQLDINACTGPVPQSLLLTPLSHLSATRQANVLRFWIRKLSLATPDHRHLHEIISQLEALQNGRQTRRAFEVDFAGVQIAAFDKWLFAMARLPSPPADFENTWDMRTPLQLPPGCGRLQAQPHEPCAPVTVRFRQGGERLLLPGRAHHSRLKTLLQSAAVPGWVRARVPLVYRNDRLVAVADYWRAEDGPALRWLDSPVGADLPRVVATGAFG